MHPARRAIVPELAPAATSQQMWPAPVRRSWRPARRAATHAARCLLSAEIPQAVSARLRERVLPAEPPPGTHSPGHHLAPATQAVWLAPSEHDVPPPDAASALLGHSADAHGHAPV